MKEIRPWKVLHRGLAFDNPWHKVRCDRVELPDGTILEEFYTVIRPEVVLAFVLTEATELLLVRQYRHGAEEVVVELPGGVFDPKEESALEAAQRELSEETGFEAPTWESLGTVYENPAKETNRIHMFMARGGIKTSEQKLDLTEAIEVLHIPVADLPEWLISGRIGGATSQALIFQALWRLQKKS